MPPRRCFLKLLGAVYMVLGVTTAASNIRDPVYAWPLGNVSLYNDVMGSQNVQHDENKKCFIFIDGPENLPYSVLDIEEEPTSCFDANLKGSAPLRDLTISFFVYPDNDMADISGTLLHYQAEDREIMRIRSLANTFLVSFRDEYGMSAGMMYVVNFLTPHEWNHVTVARDYQTGRITVYKDGVQMYNEDDEFSDVISFPSTGKLRMGKSQDPDDEDLFEGYFACVQMYDTVVSEAHQPDILPYCQPEAWNNQYNNYYEESSGKWCLADPPVSTIGAVVTMTTLTRESLFKTFLQQHGLTDSGMTSRYLKMKSRDKRPALNDDLIGNFNATDGKVCARLCMRVDGCVSMLVEPVSPTMHECSLYDDEPVTFVDSLGALFYVIVDKN